jgi:hypothetical protein
LKRRRKNRCEFCCSRGRGPHFSSSSLERLCVTCHLYNGPIFNICYKSLTILHFGCVFCCLYPTWHDSARIDFSFQRLSDSLTAWCNAFEIWTDHNVHHQHGFMVCIVYMEGTSLHTLHWSFSGAASKGFFYSDL